MVSDSSSLYSAPGMPWHLSVSGLLHVEYLSSMRYLNVANITGVAYVSGTISSTLRIAPQSTPTRDPHKGCDPPL